MTDARVRAELARRAMDAGNMQAAQIAALGGPLSAQRGAVIGAANQATTAANNYLTSLSDPERLGAAYMAQMSALNPMYGLYFQNMNAQNANRLANMQADALRPPSIFESAIGLAGQTAPLWLDQVFRPTRPTTPRINIPGQTSRIFDLYKN
jgi:hypothetical protein